MPRRQGRAWRRRDHPYPAVKRSVLLSSFLEDVNKQRKRLSKSDRLTIVEQALVLLEMNYVHLPLKRAIHAVDPIQRLKLLRARLEETSNAQLPSEMSFHREMQRIFTSARDYHTVYRLPFPFNRKTAYLPFLIEEYFEEGAKDEPKFMVSKLAEGFHHPTFRPGVEVLHWNGAPIRRAIEINGENQPGSNPEARFANGLHSLTIRPLHSTMPPDEEWVVITYRAPDGQIMEHRQRWWVFTHKRGERSSPRFIDPGETKIGMDVKKAAVNEAKKILFAPGVIMEAQKPRGARGTVARFRAVGDGMKAKAVRTRTPEVLRASVIKTRRSREFGYIRIFTFHVKNTARFVREFVRLVETLPSNGLIIDVRNNGGGKINAGERLLQLFTPERIKPELFEMINTPLNLDLCRSLPDDHELAKWRSPLEQAVETGAVYSLGFPLTSEESCNSIGQIYFGPVLLIIDALCYSTTDIFTAGFSDHCIGKLLGVSGNTGAGGAEVWRHEDLRRAMKTNPKSPFRRLPKGVSMNVAFRRSIRVGAVAGGSPLEDLGVVPDVRYHITREDLLNGNRDLLKRAVEILASKRVHKLSADIRYKPDGALMITTASENISRLDLYLNGRPQRSRDVVAGKAAFKVKLPSGREGSRAAHEVMLRGFDGNKLVAALRRKVR